MSTSQTLLYAVYTPPATVYPLVHNFVEDYYQYLDVIRQGYDGWWGTTTRFTPELHPRMPVSIFLLAMGHIARAFHLWVPMAYTLARITGAIALMVLVYQLIKKTFPRFASQRHIAFAIVLFGTYWWGWSPSGPAVAPLVHAWTELDPLFRWSFIPHHLWSKVFMLAAFLVLLRQPSILHALLSILLVFLMGFTNPVVYVTFIPTLVLYTVLSLRPSRMAWGSNVTPPILAIVAAAPVLLYHRSLQMNIFPWTSYRSWEQALQYAVKPWDYAVSFGPTLPLCLLAVSVLWRMGSVGRLLIAWAASSWVMMYIASPFLPVTIERYLGGYQFIPVAIGSAVWIFSHERFTVLWLAFLVYFSLGLYASFKEHATYVAANKNNTQVYIPADLMAAIVSLDRNGSPEDVVMAPYEISTMIPGFTGKRVIAGHTMFTQDVESKRAAIREFFTTSDGAAAERILTAHRVANILAPSSFHPDWSSSVLVPVYRNRAFSVFTRQ